MNDRLFLIASSSKNIEIFFQETFFRSYESILQRVEISKLKKNGDLCEGSNVEFLRFLRDRIPHWKVQGEPDIRYRTRLPRDDDRRCILTHERMGKVFHRQGHAKISREQESCRSCCRMSRVFEQVDEFPQL